MQILTSSYFGNRKLSFTTNYLSNYGDLDVNQYYSEAIAFARAIGLIEGYGIVKKHLENIDPRMEATRAEVADA